jgi:phosphinothricin acetyltransferase
MGFDQRVAILMDRNQASVRLLEKTGFARWGHLPGIADFGGVTCGQYLYGRKI